MKLCLGSDDDVLEPRTVSDQVGILEAEAGLSHRCQSVGPSHEDGMGWDGMGCSSWEPVWTEPYSP